MGCNRVWWLRAVCLCRSTCLILSLEREKKWDNCIKWQRQQQVIVTRKEKNSSRKGKKTKENLGKKNKGMIMFHFVLEFDSGLCLSQQIKASLFRSVVASYYLTLNATLSCNRSAQIKWLRVMCPFIYPIPRWVLNVFVTLQRKSRLIQ